MTVILPHPIARRWAESHDLNTPLSWRSLSHLIETIISHQKLTDAEIEDMATLRAVAEEHYKTTLRVKMGIAKL